MSNEQKPIVDRKADKDHPPQQTKSESSKWSDLFGIGKMMDKLPLYKLSARMAYCMFFDLVLLFFVLFLRAMGMRVNDFPNAWDVRVIVFVTIVVFFVGISDVMAKKK
ncbi:hypothetical protein [Paenibacillus roseipurpureus]|uniref:Uncharacterized protein n=1 Tax=Paenibacillus roseopurpureus TaxID=2918901 RepID=A0AA96RJT7_9BACL|nr:hypothetical protein [Paenibacillus sp. MBLB1832]WNR43521.1 hypothetical protein MJB10_20790 [Paenibacillus sp. MBLB1832]